MPSILLPWHAEALGLPWFGEMFRSWFDGDGEGSGFAWHWFHNIDLESESRCCVQDATASGASGASGTGARAIPSKAPQPAGPLSAVSASPSGPSAAVLRAERLAGCADGGRLRVMRV